MTTTGRRRSSQSKRRRCCRPRSMKKKSPGAWNWACKAPIPSKIAAFPRSVVESCRTSPASIPLSKLRMSKMFASAASTMSPFSGRRSMAGTTYRAGTRFGPQGIRKISALYGTYSFELGVDLRESISMCDLGDVFTIPGNIEKTFDQVSKGVSHVYASGAFPVVLGGDHSLGFATVRGVAQN